MLVRCCALTTHVIAAIGNCHPRCVRALPNFLSAVRRYDIPDVRDHHFNGAARDDDRRHFGLSRMDRGAARRVYRHHRIHFDGANWESGAFRNGRDCSSARLFVLKIVRARLCVALRHTPTVRQPHSVAAARTRPRENHDGARALAQASCAHPCVPSCAGKYSGPPRKVRRVLPLGHTLSAG